MSFDEIFDLTAGVYFYFYNKYVVYVLPVFFSCINRIIVVHDENNGRR